MNSLIPSLLLALVFGCGSAQVAGRPTIIDCTLDNRAEIVALGLAFDQEIQRAAAEGRAIAWASITRQAINAGVSVGGCTLARLVDRALDSLFRTDAAGTLVASGSFGAATDDRRLEIAAESRKALDAVRAEFGARYVGRWP